MGHLQWLDVLVIASRVAHDYATGRSAVKGVQLRERRRHELNLGVRVCRLEGGESEECVFCWDVFIFSLFGPFS